MRFTNFRGKVSPFINGVANIVNSNLKIHSLPEEICFSSLSNFYIFILAIIMNSLYHLKVSM